MKKCIFFLFVFFINICSGCAYTANSSNGNQKDFLLKGDVKFENNKLLLSDKWWEIGKTKEIIAKTSEPTSDIEADIINCAGYLGSARITKKAEDEWQAVIMTDTVSKDAEEKIRMCRASFDSPYVASNAFAVVPQKKERKNTNLEKTDLQKAFASLSWNDQSWANCTEISDQNNCIRREKGVLSRFVGDDWADVDGDGEIDLILLTGNCNKTGDLTCGKTLRRSGTYWVEINYSKPA